MLLHGALHEDRHRLELFHLQTQDRVESAYHHGCGAVLERFQGFLGRCRSSDERPATQGGGSGEGARTGAGTGTQFVDIGTY